MYILESPLNIYPQATKKVSYPTSDLVRLVELDNKMPLFARNCSIYLKYIYIFIFDKSTYLSLKLRKSKIL